MSGWAQRDAERQDEYAEWVKERLIEANKMEKRIKELEKELKDLR